MYNSYRTTILICLTLLGTTALFGQASNTTSGSASQIDFNPNPYGQIGVIKPKPPGVLGSVYYHDRWSLGSVYLFNNQEVKDILLKYNVKTQQIELRKNLNDPDIKVIDASHVKNFSIQDYKDMNISHFRNKKNYGSAENGFFEVLQDGKIQLLADKNIMYVEAHYVHAIDVGERNDRILKVDKAFIYVGGKVVKAPKGNRKWGKLFQQYNIDISSILDNNEIDTGLVEEQKKLIRLINGLK